jgi:hypothetical protein
MPTVVWILARFAFWIGYHGSAAMRGIGAPGVAMTLLILIYVVSRFGFDLAGLARRDFASCGIPDDRSLSVPGNALSCCVIDIAGELNVGGRGARLLASNPSAFPLDGHVVGFEYQSVRS